MSAESTILVKAVTEHESELLNEWMQLLRSAGALQSGRIKEAELSTQARTFLGLLRTALAEGVDLSSPTYGPVKNLLSDLSRSRAVQGFSPVETATFVFSLKRAIFNLLNRSKLDAAALATATWEATTLLDELGLYTTEVFQ